MPLEIAALNALDRQTTLPIICFPVNDCDSVLFTDMLGA